MMINKRLINEVRKSKKYIVLNVTFQWIGLIANIAMVFSIAIFLEKLYMSKTDVSSFVVTIVITLASIIIRFFCTVMSSKMGFASSKEVKDILREKIYRKLLSLGTSYKEKLSTAEIVQISVEGVDQLETYFGSYLPQLFYSIIAPITLFVVVSYINIFVASVLLICVPLIPLTIIAVQTFAKKLLSKYWGQYTTLGDAFLENLQGLTTLKIYQADEFKNEKMNEESEKFRKITMKVLTMQLNSITVMDIVAFGGTAIGIIVAANQFINGNITLGGSIIIILLSADFFIPMRLLGSYFHIAMNGMAASEKIFRLLDLKENRIENEGNIPDGSCIQFEDVSFSYNGFQKVLNNINISFSNNGFTAVVGESGCGKSTLAAIMRGSIKGYTGKIRIGASELSNICDEELVKYITYVGFDSYLFKGTVRENLLIANKCVCDSVIWSVLEKVKLSGFLESQSGLDTVLTEKASNLSGGQRQRLCLARAILHDTPVYIFDEATSNIDIESENDILNQVYELAKTKTVVFITHRLANVVRADNIYVIKEGSICESGIHDELVLKNGVYKTLWSYQYELENYRRGGRRFEKEK